MKLRRGDGRDVPGPHDDWLPAACRLLMADAAAAHRGGDVEGWREFSDQAAREAFASVGLDDPGTVSRIRWAASYRQSVQGGLPWDRRRFR